MTNRLLGRLIGNKLRGRGVAAVLGAFGAVGVGAVAVFGMVGWPKVGYSFRGPGYVAGRGVVHPGAKGEVVVVVTRAEIQRGAGGVFGEHLRAVMASMDAQEGLIGYAVRKELVGSRVWTMSAWVDRASVERFVRSPAHRAAMAPGPGGSGGGGGGGGGGGVVPGSFVACYESVPIGRVPLDWAEADRLLDASSGRE